jgi:hypothetical protein
MTRMNTTHRKSRTLTRAMAALAVVLGAGIVSAAPPRANHDGPGVGFHFFLGLPFPPVPVPAYEPPRYYQPRVVYEDRPVHYAPRGFPRGAAEPHFHVILRPDLGIPARMRDGRRMLSK